MNSDLDGFREFVSNNNSTFTMGQRRLCGLLASHLGGPRKLVEAGVNLDLLRESKVLKFNLPDVSIREEFYVDAFNLDTANLMREATFQRSVFLKYYELFLMHGRDATYCIYHTPSEKASELFVLADLDTLNFKNTGVGGILVNYPPILSKKLVIPAKQFFRLRYPSPSA